jgi:hypothetical protein
VVISGVNFTASDSPHADALFAAGCDDALLTCENGVQRATFDREATSFADAVASAISAIEGAISGARVICIERLSPDEAHDPTPMSHSV